jgi:class 3 adenylate cyclase
MTWPVAPRVASAEDTRVTARETGSQGGRSFDAPDETVEFGGIIEQLITIGGLTVSRSVQPKGWRWRDDFKPLVGGEWCQAHHVGMVLSGRQAILLDDGTEYELGPGDLYDVRPGHDGWTVGDEDSVLLEWSGQRQWMGPGAHRVLATLLFTDIVDSTSLAASLGDAAWHDLLSVHFHACRDTIAGSGGRQVATTGDGVVAMFDAPANAVRCALALRELAARQRIEIRTGVHTGEVELAGEDVRGISVHEAARIMAEAGPGVVLVSETVALLCRGSDLSFEDAGEHELKGIVAPRRLYRVVS